MRKNSLSFVLLLIGVWLCGCTAKEQEITGYQIYYTNQEGTKLVEESYSPEAQKGEALIQELIERLLQSPTFADAKKAIPEEVTITNALLKDKVLAVNFSAAYQTMDHITEVLCRAATVKTLVQVPEVEAVEICIDGAAFADDLGNPVGAMTADSFIDAKGEGINSYQYAGLSLYFIDESGEKISKEMRNVHYSSNTSLEKVVLEQLQRGPANTKLQAVMPKGTEILGVTVKGNMVTVNFDNDFAKPAENPQITPEATIYAIVNALCDSCGANRVQIQIEGKSDIKYLDAVDISKPLLRNKDVIYHLEETEQTETAVRQPSVGVDTVLPKE